MAEGDLNKIQLTTQVENVYFLCLFSFFCFGKKQNNSYKLGQGTCQIYSHTKDLISLKCSNNIDLAMLESLDLNLHTLAISGPDFDFEQTQLCKIKFKHLILKDMTSFTFGSSCQECCKLKHKSVTLDRCYNIDDWNWKLFDFEHLHIEHSDLSKSTPLLGNRLPLGLRSLFLVSCLIKQIPALSFNNLKSIEMITISKNSLKFLDKDIFPQDGLQSLWSLDLSFNQIEYIGDYFATYFPNLIELNLQTNHLQTLPGQQLFNRWFNVDVKILNLDANALICDRICVPDDYEPHSIFYDTTECYLANFTQTTLGTLHYSNTICD